jgi:hypothetical protein
VEVGIVEVAKSLSCRVHVEEVGDDLLLHRRPGSDDVGGFLRPWGEIKGVARSKGSGIDSTWRLPTPLLPP